MRPPGELRGWGLTKFVQGYPCDCRIASRAMAGFACVGRGPVGCFGYEVDPPTATFARWTATSLSEEYSPAATAPSTSTASSDDMVALRFCAGPMTKPTLGSQRGMWRARTPRKDRPCAASQSRRCPRKGASRPVSRVLYGPAASLRRNVAAIHLGRTLLPASCNLPGRLGRKLPGSELPRRPYSVLLPVGLAVPPLLPGARWALTPPFHPCPAGKPARLPERLLR